MSSREDLRRLRNLAIDFESIGLLQSGAEDFAYFCTPVGAEYVGRIGCDGVHFILLPGDERIFCVDPAMGEEGKYVLPVGSDLREFLSFLLYCQDANPLSQIWWLTEEQFRDLLAEDRSSRERGDLEDLFAAKDTAIDAVAREFKLTPVEPYARLKALQEAFDPAGLVFSDEYYDTLGLEIPCRPMQEPPEHSHTLSAAMAVQAKIQEETMLPKDPVILLSYVNTKLRDEYPSLSELCASLNADEAELREILAGLNYRYDAGRNQFV